jgi:hypothetical protein
MRSKLSFVLLAGFMAGAFANADASTDYNYDYDEDYRYEEEYSEEEYYEEESYTDYEDYHRPRRPRRGHDCRDYRNCAPPILPPHGGGYQHPGFQIRPCHVVKRGMNWTILTSHGHIPVASGRGPRELRNASHHLLYQTRQCTEIVY